MKKANTTAPYEVTISKETLERFGSKEAKFTWVIGRALQRGVSIPEIPEKTA